MSFPNPSTLARTAQPYLDICFHVVTICQAHPLFYACRVKSSAEIEDEELAAMPKFKARPFSDKVNFRPSKDATTSCLHRAPQRTRRSVCLRQMCIRSWSNTHRIMLQTSALVVSLQVRRGENLSVAKPAHLCVTQPEEFHLLTDERAKLRSPTVPTEDVRVTRAMVSPAVDSRSIHLNCADDRSSYDIHTIKAGVLLLRCLIIVWVLPSTQMAGVNRVVPLCRWARKRHRRARSTRFDLRCQSRPS